MNQQNLVVLECNLCRDVELKHTANSVIGKLSVATNRFYKSGENFEKEVSFFDVDCFGDTAKLVAEKAKKGDEIRITGRLKQSRWEQDGQKRSQVLVVAERIEFGTKAKPGTPTDEQEF